LDFAYKSNKNPDPGKKENEVHIFRL